MVAERNQNLLKLVNSCRNIQSKKIKPFFIDKAHIAHCLNCRFLRAKLFYPWKRPYMAVRIRTHFPVFRVLVEYSFQVWHVSVNIILQRNNDALVSVPQQIIIAKTCRENEICQCVRIRHCQRNLFTPLIPLNRLPLNLHIGFFLQPLKDGAVVWIRLRICRILGHSGQGRFLSQRELQVRHIHFLHFTATQCIIRLVSAACSQGSEHTCRQCKNYYSFCQLIFHNCSPFLLSIPFYLSSLLQNLP